MKIIGLNIKQMNIILIRLEIKRAWKFINKKGTMKGSAIHDYAENTISK